MMSRLGVPPGNASREKECMCSMEMSYGEIVISERSFYGFRFFLRYKDTNVRF